MDFLIISHRPTRGSGVELYPHFKVRSSKDLMIKGHRFYAIWNEKEGLWSKEQDTATDLIDEALDEYKEAHPIENGYYQVKYMWDSDSGSIDKWKKYIQKQMPENCYHQLNQKIIFANSPVNKKDFASIRLPYALAEGPSPAWDRIVGTLYSPEERFKIEWIIGAILTGAARKIHKFAVFYGDSGTGKSTILNIIQGMLQVRDGVDESDDSDYRYWNTFSAEKLASSNAQFAMEPFKNFPLVAIDGDGNLDKIETNTGLNSLVSHEAVTVNAKYDPLYSAKFGCMLLVGTNRPVRITDSRSGIIRRLIDIHPSGNLIPADEYFKVTEEVKFEYGAIAHKCISIYNSHKKAFDSYIPQRMLGATNDFYNFLDECLDDILNDGRTTLACAWEHYLKYCERARVPSWAIYSRRVFGEELKNYFKVYEDRGLDGTGARKRQVYSGFKYEKLGRSVIDMTETKSVEKEHWLKFESRESIFDTVFADTPAQYEIENSKTGKVQPEKAWTKVTTALKDLDTSRVHYIKVPTSLVVIDFDIHDETGKKSLEANLKAVRELWHGPPTYAEVSKSGAGIHLHYFYEGDPTKLSRIFAPNIEIKVFTGGSALRRRLTLCNDIPIATLNGGLPLMEVKKKVINKDVLRTQESLQEQLIRALKKDHPPHSTKCEMDFVKYLLDDAYAQGVSYDFTPMADAFYSFACKSTHQSALCQEIFSQIKWKSEEPSPPVPADIDKIVFFDIEIFPNLFVVCWKFAGKGEPVVKWINPTSSQIEDLMQYKLIGFNNRRYDNHMLYGRRFGYSEEQLYKLSSRLINDKDPGSKFGEAYNASYADVFDFCSKKQSLKKWEIEMASKGLLVHHQELGLPWDKPVDEEYWPLVCEYCANDVLATEAAFDYNQADWNARKVLAKLSGLCENDTTRSHATRIIFGDDRTPELIYTNLATGEQSDGNKVIAFPGYRFDPDGIPVEDYILPPSKKHKSWYMGEDPSEGGYVYAEPGMYWNVTTFDVASMHPHSLIALRLLGKYTDRFAEIVKARIAVKHGDMDAIATLLGGALLPYSQTADDRKHLAQALKIIINSIYGYTSATFANPFKDPRNVDNIVAKRGALFMMTLKNEVIKRGFKVVHVKTDSIKIVNATPELAQFITDFAKKYGYQFDIEAKYEKMCLVNDAVYIAKQTEDECNEEPGCWTATGEEFQNPFVFKTLFSHEPVIFDDLCTTKSTQSAFYLDKNEGYPDVTDYENIKTLRRKAEVGSKLTKGQEATLKLWEHISAEELDAKIATGHNYIFVGRAGRFCPMKEGVGAGILLRDAGAGKYAAATGTSGYRWLESEEVISLGLKDMVDDSYFRKLADAAITHISQFGDFYAFVSDDPLSNYMNIPEDITDDEMPFEETNRVA